MRIRATTPTNCAFLCVLALVKVLKVQAETGVRTLAVLAEVGARTLVV